MKGAVIFLTLLAASALCHAESWVEVRHGAFAAPGESLAQVRATLKDTVAAAILPKGARCLTGAATDSSANCNMDVATDEVREAS
jgi:hypothetical protein